MKPQPPQSVTPRLSAAAQLQRARRDCRQLAHRHYENFLVASIFVPRQWRQDFYNVYAFCRTADDLADESPNCEMATAALNDFQQQLDATFAGSPPPNLFLALAETIDRHELSQQPFDDLLAAFQQDQTMSRYESRQDLMDYCQCSANPVGQIILQMANCYDPAQLDLSDSICTALQLANFCQDAARDFELGRIYFPRDDWSRHQVDETMFAASTTAEPLKWLLKEYCDLAESMFRDGLPLADQVPAWLSRDIRLFAHGGLATLRAIRAIDHDVLRIRPTVRKTQQFKLLVQAWLGRL